MWPVVGFDFKAPSLPRPRGRCTSSNNINSQLAILEIVRRPSREHRRCENAFVSGIDTVLVVDGGGQGQRR